MLHLIRLFVATRGRSRRRERGTITVEKLIMIGLIVVPLVLILILFRNQLAEWYRSTVETLFKSGSDTKPSDAPFDLPK